MKTYLISYDLVNTKSTQEHIDLSTHIKSYQIWAKPLDSLWLIKTDLTVNQIVTNILSFLGADDRLLVIEITDNWLSYNLSTEVVQWLQAGV